MADNEVRIGEKTIGENTKITMSVKVAIWIISGIIMLFSAAFTISYSKINNKVSDYKEQMDKDKSDFIKAVDAKLDEKLGTFETKDEEFIKEIGDIQGDVKVILDRTSGNRMSDEKIQNSNANTPPGKK